VKDDHNVGFHFYIFFVFSIFYMYCCMNAFVMLGLVSSIKYQVIGLEECLWNYLFLCCMTCENLTQSVGCFKYVVQLAELIVYPHIAPTWWHIKTRPLDTELKKCCSTVLWMSRMLTSFHQTVFLDCAITKCSWKVQRCTNLGILLTHCSQWSGFLCHPVKNVQS